MRIESNYRLEEAHPAQSWDENAGIFSFVKQPMPATRDPSAAVTFNLRLVLGSDGIVIAVDVTRPWCELPDKRMEEVVILTSMVW